MSGSGDFPDQQRGRFASETCSEPRSVQQSDNLGIPLQNSVSVAVITGGKNHGKIAPARDACADGLIDLQFFDGAGLDDIRVFPVFRPIIQQF